LDNPSKNIRFGLIVFIALVVFCIAQLAWWVIFQIDQSSEQFQNQISAREQRIELVSRTVNNEFSRIVNQVNFFIATQSNPDILNRHLELILENPAVLGYSFATGKNQEILSGKIDSTYYAAIGNEITLYFDKQYVADLFKPNAGEFLIDFSVQRDGRNGIWVDRNSMTISPQTIEHLKDESGRAVKMFASEGTIFFFIMILGAYLIYRALQKSEELKARQTNFIHAVTHEFKTPLTSIRLYLETVQSGKIDDSRKNEIYGKMIEDCDRLDAMVDDVLDAGRFDSNKLRMELFELNLSNELGEYIDNLENYIRRQNGILNREIENGIRIRGNTVELSRVIKILVENALKYSPPNKRVIDVKLTSRNNRAVITVSDRGFGIENSELKNIFDRFYRISNSNTETIKGTGLGLFIAARIIKAHGGTITAQSAGIDQGSTFIMELPMVTE